MKFLVIVSVVLLTVAPIFSEPELEVNLEFVPNEIVLGEPLAIHITVRNQSQKNVLVPKENSYMFALSWGAPTSEGFLEPKGGPTIAASMTTLLLEPDQTIEYYLRSKAQGPYMPRFCKPGTYSVQVTVNTEGNVEIGKEVLGHSREIKLTIHPPEGVNLEAYEMLKKLVKYPNLIDLECFAYHVPLMTGDSADALLSEYPTSTYAGYALLGRFRDYTNWRYKKDTVERRIEEAMDPDKVFSEEDAQLTQLLQTHLSGRYVSPAIRPRLFLYLGEMSLQRNDFRQAEIAFKESVESSKTEDQGTYTSRAREYLETLVSNELLEN